MTETDYDRPSTPVLIGDAIKQATALFSAELQLAKIEISEKVFFAVIAVVGIAVAGVFSIVALIFLLAGITGAIATKLPLYISCFIVGGVILAVALIAIAFAAINLSHMSFKPERTLRQIKNAGSAAKGSS